MVQLHTAVTIFLIILLTYIDTTKTAHIAKFRSARVRWSQKYFTNFTVFAQNDTVFVELLLKKPLRAGYKSNIDFQIRLSDSKNYQTLFSYTLDICNLLVSNKDTIFKKWLKSLLKYGNFMAYCPVNNGYYYLNGWKLESSLVPAYLYPGDYRIKIYGFNGKYNTKREDFVIALELDTIITLN